MGDGDLPEGPVFAEERVATSGDSPAGDEAPKALSDAPPLRRRGVANLFPFLMTRVRSPTVELTLEGDVTG